MRKWLQELAIYSTKRRRFDLATMSDKPNLITTAKVQQVRLQRRGPHFALAVELRCSAELAACTQMLEENFEYIKTIQRRQEEGQAEECMQWQKKLQENLTFLAKIADAQPAHQVRDPNIEPHHSAPVPPCPVSSRPCQEPTSRARCCTPVCSLWRVPIPCLQAPVPQYGVHPGAMHPAALLRPQQATYAAHPGYAHTSAPAYAPQPTAAPAQQYPGTAAHSAQQQARQFATPLAHAGSGAAPSYYTPLSQPPSAPAYGYTQPTAAAAQPGGAAWLR